MSFTFVLLTVTSWVWLGDFSEINVGLALILKLRDLKGKQSMNTSQCSLEASSTAT